MKPDAINTGRRAVCAAGALALAGCATGGSGQAGSGGQAGAVAELASTGKLRAAINFGNPILATRTASGEGQGVSVDLAREAARRLGVPLELVLFNSAGNVVEAVKARQVDLAFVAIDPVRGVDMEYTAPYVIIEGAYLVRNASALQRNEEVDRAGTRIAVGRGSAYDLYLTREVKAASLVRVATSPVVTDEFLAQNLDVAAGVKQQLEADAKRVGGVRLLPGRFMVIEQAMGVPKGRLAAQAWLGSFIEDMKASGFVAGALRRHGIEGAAVAPPGADQAPRFYNDDKESIMKKLASIVALAAICAGCASPPPPAAMGGPTVKVTSLGGIDGEFCPQDRALIFEDPNGTRILYDPGRTVAGATDPRLGKIDIILVSHMHGDHVGNSHTRAPNSGSCAAPDMSVSALPNTLAVNIALAKKSKIITGSDMPSFFAAKLRSLGGNPADSILARFGGSVMSGGVRIATVTAMHSNGVDPDYIPGELGKMMKDVGIWGDVGLATGYVLRFSTGLTVYLSGDTGVTADQERVVRDYYRATLAVMNIGDGFTTGPAEAAYVMNDLVKPNTVIASHANEVGTVGGKVRAGSKTEAFIKAAKMPVVVPLSGKVMEFDAAGICKANC